MVLAFFSILRRVPQCARRLDSRRWPTWLEGAEVHPEFNFVLAGLTLLLAGGAIVVAMIIYRPGAQKAGVDDPLRKLGFVFAALNKKYGIDELYGLLFVRPFIRLSQFLADVIDWRFWHDWFHERAIRDTFLKITGLPRQIRSISWSSMVR